MLCKKVSGDGGCYEEDCVSTKSTEQQDDDYESYILNLLGLKNEE